MWLGLKAPAIYNTVCAVRDTTVGNETGIGGRNQEFCLSAARWIDGSKNIVFGSVDTDGTDGPGVQYTGMIEGMPACLGGGIVDGYTMDEAKKGDMLARLMSPSEYSSLLPTTGLAIVFASHRINQVGLDSEGWFCITKADNFYKAEAVKVRKETLKFVLRAVFW